MKLEKILHPGALIAGGIATGTLATGIQQGAVSSLGFLSACLFGAAVAVALWRTL